MNKNNQHTAIIATAVTIGVIIVAILTNSFLMVLFNSVFASVFNLGPINFWQTAKLNLILIILGIYFKD